MTDNLYHLEECVKAAEQCVQTQDRAISQLATGIRDLPRLTAILHNERHFLLLPEPLLRQYKGELAEDLSPQIDTLIDRAEKAISRHEKRAGDLRQTLELVKNSSLDPATLPSSTNSTSTIAQSKPNSSARNPGKIPFDMKQLDAAQKRRFIMLKGKKDRLERELSKLS
ncbi:hypothetical protein FFLO_00304 [Filobasidium floriforme]|uniref:DASH complex subunit SPC19 n=1 Tax=Filobasidium floriforme TaxID=5210 RepID=A0A8K0JSA2_9TREE|nr:DASH complex subunit Spc19 [Filobasidium floriforme]KAG7575485.1 hypothetical protein FFLO_00304 [Filobasidium floriforme]KAH8082623.1 DASH complex subunit Spc19 [Filobasidium floriforme]